MATPPPTIDPVPTPYPQRNDRTTFSDRVDAFITWLQAAGAQFEAVAENVYDNATIAEGSGDVASVGLGITTTAPYMANVDNVAIAAGFWYINGSTTGTFPAPGAGLGMIIHKVYGTNGFQMLSYAANDRMFFRRRTGSAWAAWKEIANLNDLTKASVGLSNVDNTSDANKPVSTPQATAINAKANNGVNTDITQLNGVTNVTMGGVAPTIEMRESDQTGALGKWRIKAEGDTFFVQKNTAAGGDFSTAVFPFSAGTDGKGYATGNVQQGTGVGQGTNTIKIGWATPAGGLKCTVDSTDQGYIPFVTSNPSTGSTITFNGPQTLQISNATDGGLLGYAGTGAVSFMRIGGIGATGGIVHRFDRATGDYFIGYGNSGSETNRIVMDANGAVNFLGGSLASLSNKGFVQIGGSGGLNLVFDYTQIQARSNGATATLNLNNNGGLVNVGSGGLTSSGLVTASNGLLSNNSGTLKVQLNDGASPRGFLGASSSQSFIVTNGANSVQAFYVDQSGNATAAGNITASSDERLKANWRKLRDDFLDRLADVYLIGVYDRIDVLETHMGMSAQQIQTFAPELVVINPETQLLSLDYGKLGGVAAVLLAKRNRDLSKELDELKNTVNKLIEKVGNV